MIIILMGVSGAGKTTIGKLLANELGWSFHEGDEFHPKANIEKMEKGIPLTDGDREQWLHSLRGLINSLVSQSQDAAIACSALKQTYRDELEKGVEDIYFIYLKGNYDLIEQRLKERSGHYMKAGLLKSQFDTLEEPGGVLVVDVGQEPAVLVGIIKQSIHK